MHKDLSTISEQQQQDYQDAEEAMNEFIQAVHPLEDIDKESEELQVDNVVDTSRILPSDKIPLKKPAWLSSNMTPVNDGGFTIQTEYPNLYDPDILQKKLVKRMKNKKNKSKKKVQVIYREVDNPIEWLRRTYWCRLKKFKSTLIIDPQDEVINLGDGDLDCFEYLKYQVNKMYKNLNEIGYENRYFCFHKQQKRWHPVPKHILLNVPYNELADLIEHFVEKLEVQKKLPKVLQQKRKQRYYEKEQKLSYDLNRFGIKPQVDLSQNLTKIEKDLRELKNLDEWQDEDGQIRYTKLGIITKRQIHGIFGFHNDNVPYTKIAKDFRIGYRRITKLLKRATKLQKDGWDAEEVGQKVYDFINKAQLEHEKINKEQVKILRAAVLKKGKNKNAYILTKILKEKLQGKYKNPMISVTKTKSLLKKYCALSYKKFDEINSNKITKENIQHRESFIRLFVQHGSPFDFKNCLCYDETAWHAQQNSKRGWSLIGQPDTYSTKTKGRRLTLLCCISVFGVENFIVIQGSDKKLLWCYFVYEAAMKFLSKHPELNPKDLLLLFDNAKAHVVTFAGWWNRQMPGIKMTIAPYSPEFNPIERLFRSIKSRFPDSYENETMQDLTAFLVSKFRVLPKHLCLSYFQTSLKEMGKFICQLYDPQSYGKQIEKRVLKKRKRKQIYKCLGDRYLFTNKNQRMGSLEDYEKSEQKWKLKKRISSKSKGKKPGRPLKKGFKSL